MAHPSPAKRSKPTSSALDLLASPERGQVLDALLARRPSLAVDAERIAAALLASVSAEEIAAEVEAAMLWIPLDALATRAGRVRGRGYVHETDAAWELVEEAIEPYRSDLERRAALGLTDAAAVMAVGIVAGLYGVREPEMGSVLAYAGEDTPSELAAGVIDRAGELGLAIPVDAAATYWPDWTDLR